ncbi:hypothetical protein FJT64_012311 [Amphibalanus amphitrite]|uniref:Uncharacterized protein n=1 Tax=Amphibalanus amphitrite TaxID=1232801 RepID=A0A6A4VJ54_AMPAM|nr:hypothetical protein FJT64_012311 [Amphibalanus amphitrite]
MVKLVPLKTGSIATPPTGRQLARKMAKPVHEVEDLVLERAKQIMRLKLRVRRLEVKCLRLMGVTKAGDRAAESAAPAAEIAPAAGSDKAVGARSGAPYEDTEDSPRPETAEAPTVGGRTLTDEPLLILRNDPGPKLPPILTLLKDNQLSERAANAVPSNLREAKEVNHQLKTQYLNLQASVLKWAMQNKVHNDRLIEAAEKRKALADSARDSRLRYLLRLEAAIKDMFTEAQIRHIIRRYEDSSGVSADKRTVIQWGEADVLRMLELRAISSDTVIRHVRDKMNIPLPTLKTVKLRCTKSPALSEAYVDMLQKSEANQKRCDMCERQVSTIDEVIGDGGPQPRADANRFGRSYEQGVPQPSHRLQGARPKKRRTTDTATVSGAKSRRRVRPAPGWLDSSDSSVSGGQLCGPGAALCGGRVAAARAGWNPEVVDTRAGLLDSSPDGLGGLQRRSWS